MKKMLHLLLPFTLTAALLAGCQSANSGTSPSPAPGTTAKPASNGTSAAAGKTTQAETSKAAEKPKGPKTDMLLWLPPFASGNDGALDKQFWTQALAPWADAKNVNLTIEITPWGHYEEKYLTAFSSGEGPDVGYMYNEMYSDFIDMGALEPLDSYLTDADRSNYLYLDKGFIKGKQYTLPIIVGNARIPIFNMDILKKAGVTKKPETWQELIDALVKIKDANLPGVMPFAQEWASPGIGALNNLFYPYLWQAGGDIYNKDGTKVTLMDNDAAVRAAQFLYDLKFKYKVIPKESMALVDTELQNQFIAGHIAIASMSAAGTAELTKAGVNWDFIPSFKDKTTATWVAADALIMNSSSKHKELAWDLMKYITSADVMSKFHTQVQPFPPITKDEPYHDNPRFKAMYADTAHLHTLPVAKGSFKVMDTLYKNLQLMMLGELTPEQAIQNTVTYSNSLN